MQWLADLLVSCVEWTVNAIWFFFTQFYSWAFEHLSVLICSALDSSGISLNAKFATEYYELLNYFFPLNEGLAMMTVLLSLWAGIWLVKVILKLIPTIY
jgi:hypothetical protein